LLIQGDDSLVEVQGSHLEDLSRVEEVRLMVKEVNAWRMKKA
jgi:hypothetical protein